MQQRAPCTTQQCAQTYAPPERSGLDRRSGFTLIEMLTVLAIIGLITAGFLLRERALDASTQFNALTQEAALVVRQAQTYGTAGRQEGGSGPPRYGASFQKPNDAIRLFQDKDEDGRVNDGNTGEVIQTFSLPQSFTIDKLCAKTQNEDKCANNPSFTDGDVLNVVYNRPSPQAEFAYKKSGGQWANANSIDDTVVIRLLEQDTNATSSIVVGKAGFTYVK